MFMQHIQVTNVGKSVLQHVQLKVIKINIRGYIFKCKTIQLEMQMQMLL